MKKVLILMILFSMLTGCTDYKELTDMAIISSIAIDYKDDKYDVIIQVLDSNSKEEKEPSIILYNDNGNTLQEAFRNISLKCPKKLYFGHIRTFIVKDTVFKDGASNFIDFVLRNQEIEKDFNLFITNEEIKDIMNIETKLITIPSDSINKTIKNAEKVNGKTRNIYFDNFLMTLYSKGIDPVLPSIKIKDNDLILDNKLAIFKKDKFISYLDSDASLGYNILNRESNKSIITFKCDDKNYSSMEILDIDSNYKFDNNTLIINLKLVATVKELNCNIDITNNKSINKLKDMFIDKTKEIINKTINNEQKSLSDYIGIGRYIYKNNYNYYIKNNNIDNVIKNMKSIVNIDATLTQKSSIRKGDEKY